MGDKACEGYKKRVCDEALLRGAHHHSVLKKSSFQPAGTKLRYSGFKCSSQHSEQEAFKGKTHILLPAVEGGLFK